MRVHLRRPIVFVPLALALLYAAYVAGGYLLVPALIRAQAQAFVAERLTGKTLSLGEVSFNPFTLEADIADLAVRDTRMPAAPLLAARRLVLNVSAGSIFRLSPSLDLLAIEGPRIEAVLRRDGSLNLLELIPADDGEPRVALRIASLTISGGHLAFTDQRAAKPHRKELHTVGFALSDFATTSAEGGGFKFDAEGMAGERLEWTGTLSMAPLASQGRYAVHGLKLATVSYFLGDLLPATIDDGILDMAGDYRFAARPAADGAPARTEFDASLASVGVRNLTGATRSGERFSLANASLGPSRYSLAEGRLSLGAVDLAGLTAIRPTGEAARMDRLVLSGATYGVDGRVAETGAVKADGIAVTGRSSEPATIALAALTIEPSRIDIANASVSAGKIGLSGLKLPLSLNKDNDVGISGIYPLTASASTPAAAAPVEAPWRWRLAGVALDNAALQVMLDARDGQRPGRTIDIAPAELTVGALDDVVAQPVPVALRATLNGTASVALSGQMEAKAAGVSLAVTASGLPLADLAAMGPPVAAIEIRSGTLGGKGDLKVNLGNKTPAVRFTGNATIADLKVIERAGGGDLLSWARLDASGIDYRGDALRIQRIKVDRPVSQVTITPEARLNLAVLAGPPQAETPVIAPVVVKALAIPRPAARPMTIRVGKVEFVDGTIGFADQSIEPNFAVSIKGFSGTIGDLSSVAGTRASFDLKGYVVDRFAPVAISGSASPFAYDQDTDITASFRNIELPVFNPYSGTYAGYAIAKGKLSSELHYRIVDRKLEASHHIVLDQLEWGDATGSKKQVSLPIRLASSLLKDRHGVITLDLPVTGAVDDPKFRIGPIIWQVVGNVLGKIVTAPFTMIGNLFKGADKAQFIAFDAGSDALPAQASANLAALAKGLADRTEVTLDIPAGSGVREDAEAMTTARLEAAALAVEKGAPASYADLDDGDKADRLRKVYKQVFGAAPAFPDDMPSAGLFAGSAASQAEAAAQVKWLEAALRPKFEPNDADLAALGQTRAQAIKSALLADGALDAGRVFVSTAEGPAARDGRMVLELKPK